MQNSKLMTLKFNSFYKLHVRSITNPNMGKAILQNIAQILKDKKMIKQFNKLPHNFQRYKGGQQFLAAHEENSIF